MNDRAIPPGRDRDHVTPLQTRTPSRERRRSEYVQASPSTSSTTAASTSPPAGMSRSAFSARFTKLVGEPAMRYLARWRLQLARTHLQQTPEPLSAVAHRFGYQSETAFCRAFKRTFGVSPGSVRPTAAPDPGWRSAEWGNHVIECCGSDCVARLPGPGRAGPIGRCRPRWPGCYPLACSRSGRGGRSPLRPPVPVTRREWADRAPTRRRRCPAGSGNPGARGAGTGRWRR